MRVGVIRGGFAALVAACLVANGDVARADDRAACASSYEKAQVLRRDERLQGSRDELLVCQQKCPAQLALQCATWLREVDALTPTVRFVARDPEGHALDGVRVEADTRLLADTSEAPVAIDPGRHVFHFERRGFAPADVNADVRAGDRDRSIAIVLTPLVKPGDGQQRPPATASYVLGGAGIGALALAGVLAIKGDLDRSSLRSSCAPACNPSDLDHIRALWWTAGGLAAVGAIAIGAAVVLWPRDDRKAASAMPALAVAPRAVALSWRLP